jgi:hypothetical protein
MLRRLLLGLPAALVFMLSAVLLLRAMPKPLRPTDFMVVGTVSTLAALVVLFAGILIAMKQRDAFFKRRRKPDSAPD